MLESHCELPCQCHGFAVWILHEEIQNTCNFIGVWLAGLKGHGFLKYGSSPPIHYFPIKQTISWGFGRSTLLRYTHVGLKLYQVGPIFWGKNSARFSVLRCCHWGSQPVAIAKQVLATGTKRENHQSTNTPCGFGAWQFLEKIYRFEANIYRFSDLIVKLSLRSSVTWILWSLTFFLIETSAEHSGSYV